jgi:catechol 2,3-dioxygenase-like lactoylglutathione lyase family enzyme
MIKGLDHVALPMQNVDAMLGFYKALGADIHEEFEGFLHSAYLGSNKINLHTPRAWQSDKFHLRGPAAVPGCGDLCFVWEGTIDSIRALLTSIDADIIEGPIDRKGGLKEMGCSVYIRDPDQNLLEFIVYK